MTSFLGHVSRGLRVFGHLCFAMDGLAQFIPQVLVLFPAIYYCFMLSS